ncbi:hypothetical protein E4O03_09015 [Treponema sp. OMZ 792]|uniref:hypothetical protein n=1 Tax=unclassified Treponema TaxID=2638727 RepID=UPI0020A40C0F|nr:MULTISPECIES: hypothetical protein [unclassified Treponema]UTC74363.1 hypothetical protein E4O03_09015 [Treponema sp. OMZ 792]UTC80761.1 hypothetical protein E4O07_08925 [Treponema sp. OMZ 798]
MKHKNFVSMAALLILVLSAVFLVTACPTGTGPSSGSNSGGTLTPPAVSAEETELTALLGKISLDKTIITAASESITISNLPSVPEVRADIASNNIELIEYEAPNQLKVKALPTETADVKITITLTKNGISKSRDFTVKVFKSGDTPTEDDYFNTLTIPTTVSDDFDLPKELKNTESTAITWSTENENIIKIENSGTNPKALIAFDIVERKVKLKATVNGKSKKFEVTVLPVVKIEINNGPNDKKVYEFTQNGITIKEFQDDKLLRGNLYSYTLDDTNKQITVRLTSAFSPEGTWITIEEYYSLMTDMNITALKNQLEGIDALLSKPTISIAETKEVLKNFSHEDMSGYTDEEFFNEFLKDALDMEYNEFTALSPQEQTEKIKAVLIEEKKEIAMSVGLPENASTEDILAEFKKQFQQQAAQQIKEAKEPHTYSYSIRKDSEGKLYFGTTEVYNPSKAWYENRGHWDYHPASSETSWISDMYARKLPNGIIKSDLSIQEDQGGHYNHKHYRGTITGSGPDYTFNGSREDNPGEQITATITDNKNGTIRVKVTSGGTAESTLTFRGHSL